MTPYDLPELFSTIVLGNSTSPGKVTLSGHDRNPDWDVQKAKGTTGATTKLTDPQPPGEFTASFFLADAEEIIAWDAFQQVLKSTFTGPTPVALPIYHPDLARNDFTEVVCSSIGGLTHDRTGGATIVVKFREYRPPKPKPTQRAGAKAAGDPAKAKYDPNAAARREFSELWDEVTAP
jgi:hypothetical protein